MKKDLNFVSQDKLIIIYAHIHVHYVENKQELYDILKQYKVHILSGHMHVNQHVIKENIHEHIQGTVCGAWWKGTVCPDGTPLGYGVYKVKGTNLEWFYKSVGFKKEYQYRTNVLNNNGQPELQVNVWNWYPEWKVEAWADESYTGIMDKINSFDLHAVVQYKGDKLPAGAAWIEPRATEHIFSVKIQPGIKKIKVKATDPFGNEYETVTDV